MQSTHYGVLTLVLSPLFYIASSTKSVSQFPADLLRKDGESAVFECLHGISGYNYILWYKQAPNRELQFLGRLAFTDSEPEAEFRNKVTFSGEGNKNGTLTINALTSNDTAVYFCAAFAQCLTHSLSSTKTWFEQLYLTTECLSAHTHLGLLILRAKHLSSR